MISSVLYFLLAALGLGVLIFIHELGHYFMARRVGMRVEAFGIGFGRPIYTWKRDGVEWRVCWLPFGGYVKIAGMEAEDGKDPYEISDGFFGKSPWQRIKVAFIGPFVNLVFAFLIFTLLWMSGGREKNFTEFTSIIGWLDPQSELYADGVRPGDMITEYNGQDFQGARDHIFAPLTASDALDIKGFKINPLTRQKTPFDYTVKPYPNPSFPDKEMKTGGILASAGYLIYQEFPKGQGELLKGSPVIESGIQNGDRVVWVDGEMIYSPEQLSHLLNDGKALLTIERDQEILLRRVPRVPVDELKVDASFKEELADWQYESRLKETGLQKLKTIPYSLANSGVVEGRLKFIDPEQQAVVFPKNAFAQTEAPLKAGDRILAVDGMPIKHAYQILSLLQERQVNIIVQRDPALEKLVSWQQADQEFNRDLNVADLEKIGSSIGTDKRLTDLGTLHLLHPVVPKMRSEIALTPEAKARQTTALAERRKMVEQISDAERRIQMLNLLDAQEKQYILGLPEHDLKVTYNPGPVTLFANVLEEIWITLKALVMGYLSPKWLAGPLGIVQVAQSSLKSSLKDGLFWIGAISLNLGVLNLLPIPVLDGGHICIALYEMVTRRRMQAKTIERLIIPFAILMIGFFIYVTYNDLLRLFGSFLS
jgi:regulator of sigma E protease